MLPNPHQPVRSFLSGCAVLAVAVTGALMVWTLRAESGQKYCVPDGGTLYGVCRPTLEFLFTGAVWLVLIWGALALPIVSILVLRKMAARRRPPEE